MPQKGQKGEPPHFAESVCAHKNGLGELHPEPMLDTSVNENFMKNNFLNLKSNFDQTSQKKLKTQSYMANLISKIPNREGQI